jgi:hypothetical protein
VGSLDDWAKGQLEFYRAYLADLKTGRTVTGERRPGTSEIVPTTAETIKIVETQIGHLEAYFAGQTDLPPSPNPEIV